MKMDNSKYDEVIERLFYEQLEEVRNKKFSLYLLKPLPGAQTLLMANRTGGKTTLMREFQERLMRDGQVWLSVDNVDELSIPSFAVVKSHVIRVLCEPPGPELIDDKCWFNEWPIPKVSGKKAWEPAKWQGGTDHTAPLKHGKDPKAVAKRRKKKKLASKR